MQPMVENEAQKFANRLQTAMKESTDAADPTSKYGVDVGKLADVANVSWEMARRYLLGEAVPGRNKLVDIAHWLDVRVGWLRDGETPKRADYSQTGSVEDEIAPYLDKVCINLDLITFVMRFINENYASVYSNEPPEGQAETIYALCDLFSDEAAKNMKPANVIKLIRKTA